MTIADALASEIVAHQFGDKPQPPGRLLQAFRAATSPKIWSSEFGVYLCPCNVKALPLLQTVMLIRGDISSALNVYQGCYHPGVGASAGSHDKGGPVDLGQFDDRHLTTERECGFGAQHRTTAQGFSGDHDHQFPIGCQHGSPLASWQQEQWQQGRNGLASNGPITGPGPIGKDTPHWTEGVKKMEAEIMLFADDVANKVVSQLRPLINNASISPADVINWAGINVSTNPKKPNNWSLGHIASLLLRVVGPMNNTVSGVAKVQAAQGTKIDQLTALVNGLIVTEGKE